MKYGIFSRSSIVKRQSVLFHIRPAQHTSVEIVSLRSRYIGRCFGSLVQYWQQYHRNGNIFFFFILLRLRNQHCIFPTRSRGW